MLNATIAGNIGADAVTRVAGQTTVTGFNVAVEQRGKDGKKTQWVGCSMWGKRGETLAQYLTKGGKVCASGELTTREHDGKTYVELNVSELTLMGGAPGGNSGGDAGYSGQRGYQDLSPQERKALDDEIPF
jgi:single-strand DNA-binding protein